MSATRPRRPRVVPAEERERQAGRRAAPDPCYGTRKVVSAVAEPIETDGYRMRYRYRIVDVPAWANDAAVRRAYPFLDRALAGPLTSTVAAFEENGRWQVPDPVDARRGRAGGAGLLRPRRGNGHGGLQVRMRA